MKPPISDIAHTVSEGGSGEARIAFRLRQDGQKGIHFLDGLPEPDPDQDLGTAEFVEDDPELMARLVDPDYRPRPQRVLLFHLKAWDVNCQQHIRQRFTPDEVVPEMEKLRQRIRELDAVNAALRRDLEQATDRGGVAMRYQFLIDTYETELLKVLSVWSMFRDEDLPCRPHPTDPRGRSVHEQMVHQCVSEDLWFRTILSVDVGAPPLPTEETRLEFIRRYAKDSTKRLEALRSNSDAWWEEAVQFFDVVRSRAWVMVRRIAHTAYHRGQQTAMLRMLNRDLHSSYGPTADTGGLMQDNAPVIYAYRDLASLLEGESCGGRKVRLPGPGGRAVTERA